MKEARLRRMKKEKTIPRPLTAAGSKHVLDRIRNMELLEIPHPVILSEAKDPATGARSVCPGAAIHPAPRRRDPSSAKPPQDDRERRTAL